MSSPGSKREDAAPIVVVIDGVRRVHMCLGKQEVGQRVLIRTKVRGADSQIWEEFDLTGAEREGATEICFLASRAGEAAE